MGNGRTDQLNAFITLLTNAVAAPDLTITVDTAPVLALPYYLVLDPLTPQREYVLVTGAVGSVLTVTRNLSGTGSSTHIAGEPVVMAPMAQHFEDIWDILETLGGQIDHTELTGVVTDQHHTKYTDLEAIAAVGPHTTLHTDLSDVAALPDAHHTRYTDPEAVSAVAADDAYVQLLGDTMTGLLILSGDPANVLGAATKQYVDGAVPGESSAYQLDAGTADSRPGAGLWRRNNAVPASVTFIYWDYITSTGIDFRDELLNLGVGQTLYITSFDGLITEAYNVTVDAVDATDYARIAVTFNQQNGVLPVGEFTTFKRSGVGLGDATYLRRDGGNAPTANIPFGLNKITGLGLGADGADAANLDNIDALIVVHANLSGAHPLRYTDAEAIAAAATDTTFLALAGGTMAGNLTLATDPTLDLHAATKKYVDDNLSPADHFTQVPAPLAPTIGTVWVNPDEPPEGVSLLLDGTLPMEGELLLGNNPISGVLDPTAAGDVGDRGYNDGRYATSGHTHAGGTGAWQTPSLLAGWSNFGSGFRNARYRLNNGTVELEGMLNAGTTSVGTTIITFPAGFRPDANIPLVVETSAGSARVDINSNGNLRVDAGFSGASWGSFQVFWGQDI